MLLLNMNTTTMICDMSDYTAQYQTYNYLKEVREQTWSDGARYDGRNGRRTLPGAMRTM
jgi:hypothetical protein